MKRVLQSSFHSGTPDPLPVSSPLPLPAVLSIYPVVLLPYLPLSLLYLPLPNKIPNKTVVILNSYRSTTNRHEVLPPARHESGPRGEWSSPVLKHIKKIEFQESTISNPIRVLSVKLMAATQQSTDLRSSLQYFIDNTKTLALTPHP
jgi:hypothetical protein